MYLFYSSCPSSPEFPWTTTSSWCVTSSSCWWLWLSTPAALQGPSTSASLKISLLYWVLCRPARFDGRRVRTAFVKCYTNGKYICRCPQLRSTVLNDVKLFNFPALFLAPALCPAPNRPNISDRNVAPSNSCCFISFYFDSLLLYSWSVLAIFKPLHVIESLAFNCLEHLLLTNDLFQINELGHLFYWIYPMPLSDLWRQTCMYLFNFQWNDLFIFFYQRWL